MRPGSPSAHLTYGLGAGDWRGEILEAGPGGTRFRVRVRGQLAGEAHVRMPGVHYAENALAALCVADFLGVPFARAGEALAGFEGVDRRFSVRGEAGGVLVVDDYGHHPTELAATIAAARLYGRRLVVAFQPHRYSRTRDLLRDFAPALAGADALLLTDIYPAGEAPLRRRGRRGAAGHLPGRGARPPHRAWGSRPRAGRDRRPGRSRSLPRRGRHHRRPRRAARAPRSAHPGEAGVSAPQTADDEARIVVDLTSSHHRGWFRRRSNRRITVSRASVVLWVAGLLRALGARLVFAGKILVVIAFVAGAALAGRQLVRHVIASPRFAVRDIRVGPTTHVSDEDVRALAGVQLGDRLLAVDPDAVAAALTTHPWIASARVRRELPSVLAIDVVERHAVASALVGALYLLDDAGRPFKRATFEEADGLPVITGVTREQYAAMRGTSEAVFREALNLLSAYVTGHPERPKLSEVHADPRIGFSLVLLDGGGEIRLGRGGWEEKLARFDRILGTLDGRGAAALTTVYLDGPLADRVTVRLAAVQ